MRSLGVAALIGALLAPAVALGHEHGVHARGTIQEVAPDRLVLATAEGKVQTFVLGPETRFARGSAPARREDARAGERAVVHAERRGEALLATEVRLAPR